MEITITLSEEDQSLQAEILKVLLTPKSDESDETPKTAEQPAPEAPALSMADLRKSVNAISRKKGLNWLYSWLGDLGVKSIADIPVARLEEAHTKLQNYA